MFQVQSNQYIPRKGKSTPSGMPMCATYYYVTNERGQVVSHKTLKPYRGKDLANYWFHDKESAENFAKKLNENLQVK